MDFRIAVFAGDGIGPEVIEACLTVLGAVEARVGGFRLATERLAGGIVGGMGMAPCAEVGDHHALFQPAHGSAPDIQGKGIANPIATLISAAMMPEWLGERSGTQACRDGGRVLEAAIGSGFAKGRIRPAEFGGRDTTDGITKVVMEEIASIQG